MSVVLNSTLDLLPSRCIKHLNIVHSPRHNVRILARHTRTIIHNPPTKRHVARILCKALNETFKIHTNKYEFLSQYTIESF